MQSYVRSALGMSAALRLSGRPTVPLLRSNPFVSVISNSHLYRSRYHDPWMVAQRLVSTSVRRKVDDPSDVQDPNEDAALRAERLRRREEIRYREEREKSIARRALEVNAANEAKKPLRKEQLVTKEKVAATTGHDHEDKPTPEVKKSLWVKVKEVLHHYWIGSKLLYLETKISIRLLGKVLNGGTLTRREKRQLTRTTADMVRLIPFIAMMIIPFAEFALPVLLKLFPNMLPSTFEDHLAKEEKKKRMLKVRLEMAKFLQDTVEEMAVESKSQAGKETIQFSELFRKMNSKGQQVSTDELLRFARLFEDEITLENLSGPQLESICRFMGLRTWGSSSFLRYQLRTRLHQLKEDDKMIAAEGVASLDSAELQQACSTRGISTMYASDDRLRGELQQWLDLHLKNEVPITLLIMSRMFALTEGPVRPATEVEEVTHSLQATLSKLPEHVIKEVEIDVHHREGLVISEHKLEALRLQEELIKKEEEEAKRAEEAERLAAETLLKDDAKRDVLIDLGEALSVAASKSPVIPEVVDLEDLKKDREEFREDMEDLSEKTKRAIRESKASIRLGAKVDDLIKDIEQELRKVESDIGGKLNLVRPDKGGEITAQDLERVFLALKKRPANREQIAEFIRELDANNDGKVSVKEVIRLAQRLEEEEKEGIPAAEHATDMSNEQPQKRRKSTS